MSKPLFVVRGGGDLATGVVWRLHRAGWATIVTELALPLTVRRTVSVSTAVLQGSVDVQGMPARLASSPERAHELALSGIVAVLVSPGLPEVPADVVIDARLAKRNIDTTTDDADLVIGLGPGFQAGVDCHVVVETLRGHDLGRVLWSGCAAPDTGVPGNIGGQTTNRVLRASTAGTVSWSVAIGDRVRTDQALGQVGGAAVTAPFDGVVRGLIAPATPVSRGLKIGDVDPRCSPSACHQISDKALAVGGGVLEAVLTDQARRA